MRDIIKLHIKCPKCDEDLVLTISNIADNSYLNRYCKYDYSVIVTSEVYAQHFMVRDLNGENGDY